MQEGARCKVVGGESERQGQGGKRLEEGERKETHAGE